MTSPTPVTFHQWRKSTRSNGSSDCVEIGISTDGTLIGIRDTKDPEGPIMVVDRQEWSQLSRFLPR